MSTPLTPAVAQRGTLSLQQGVKTAGRGALKMATDASDVRRERIVGGGSARIQHADEDYAKRYGETAGDSFVRVLGLRAAGVMENVGRSLLMQGPRKQMTTGTAFPDRHL